MEALDIDGDGEITKVRFSGSKVNNWNNPQNLLFEKGNWKIHAQLDLVDESQKYVLIGSY